MIRFLDLKAQYQSIKDEIESAVLAVLESGQYVLGDAVTGFEESFARYCGVAEAVGVNSGTSALHLALIAAGIGEGDEVITVSHTFVATVAAIRYVGAKPVLVDIDPTTYTMDPSQVEDAITPRTKAILPVHLYGHPADMNPLMDIARRRNLVVIEDACQSHGAEYYGKRCGSFGEFAAFSFYPGKNLGAYGEGGAVVTNNPDAAVKLRAMRNYGQTQKYYHDYPGFNYRMDGIQGAILGVKMRHIEAWTEARRERARWYNHLLRDSGYPTPQEASYARHVYHIYAVRTTDRTELQAFMKERGIESGIHYPVPVHLQRIHADLGYKKGDFPHTELAAEQVLSLPMSPELTRQDVETVVETLRDFEKTRPAFKPAEVSSNAYVNGD